ncbi:MmcQ/YjbR family DNA-binding protein [Occultella kanbiaonis]|uniref:MmcQ/YjbR family DNA-binding protein n=1 Tax=Occultella kanbiaonis TaxID=2675754 RepID=UPI0013D466FF|nr:MmcQ/YjbR family DNA-binding protein [Occultella kanbiaonis]
MTRTGAWAQAAQWCHGVCLDLPSATLDHPFGPDSDVLRVHGRMFALIMGVPHISEHLLVNLKADPVEVPLLIGTHDYVLPAWHMNKKHWISVALGPDADTDLVAGLIEDSYDTVVSRLPAQARQSLNWARDRA